MPEKADDLYIIKSEFSVAVYFLYIILIAFAGITTFLFIPQMLESPEIKGISLYILIFCFGIFDVFAILHPAVSCYNLFYDGEYLIYKWTFIPRSIKIHAEIIEGFYTMKVPSRSDEYLTAYPVSDRRVLPAISSFYFNNYEDIVNQLPGDEIERLKFTWRTYFNISVLGRRPE